MLGPKGTYPVIVTPEDVVGGLGLGPDDAGHVEGGASVDVDVGTAEDLGHRVWKKSEPVSVSVLGIFLFSKTSKLLGKFFTKVYIIVNYLSSFDGTEKPQTYLES